MAVLRLRFTADDLARVRLTKGWGPLAETYFSLTRLRRHHPRDLLGGWTARVGRTSSGLVHPCASLFDGGQVDLITLTGRTTSIEEGLEALRAVRPEHLRAELDTAVTIANDVGDRLRWVANAGDVAGSRADRSRLATFLGDYHRVAMAPYWDRIHARLSAQHAALTRVLAEQGVEGLLSALAPFARWRPPVLEVGHSHRPVLSETPLGGRGLLLVPSLFYDSRPALWNSVVDDQAPPVLLLPATRGPGDLATILAHPSGANRLAAVANLLGRTRAHALDCIGAQGSCSTGELARRLGVSPASASEHTTVLRDAGLVVTTRQGREVRHRLTTLGHDLLDGAV
ncbi:ArsR/SmtB family transcription factor [Micromonospora carbonacea]|uniref:ArsR/SmtB family transcription factor n=1 Tax=Micromonospora carbonacea TaxID=47853 RepID=UPI003D74FE77